MISKTVGRIHMHLSVDGALRRIKPDNKMSYANHDNGRPMTNKELHTYLKLAQYEGKRVLPMGDCDNFDYQTGCRGHDVTLLVHDYEFEEGNG